MLLATTQVEDFDRFMEIFSTKGAEKRKEHGCGVRYSSQAESHMLTPLRSFSNRSSVPPRASTRIVPSAVFLRATRAPRLRACASGRSCRPGPQRPETGR
jgi:hypothetical protein